MLTNNKLISKINSNKNNTIRIRKNSRNSILTKTTTKVKEKRIILNKENNINNRIKIKIRMRNNLIMERLKDNITKNIEMKGKESSFKINKRGEVRIIMK